MIDGSLHDVALAIGGDNIHWEKVGDLQYHYCEGYMYVFRCMSRGGYAYAFVRSNSLKKACEKADEILQNTNQPKTVINGVSEIEYITVNLPNGIDMTDREIREAEHLIDDALFDVFQRFISRVYPRMFYLK